MKPNRGVYYILLGMAGALLAFWPRDLTLCHYGWCEEQLSIIQDQLNGLAEILREYRRDHGEYPGMGTPLGFLSHFDGRFQYDLKKTAIRTTEEGQTNTIRAGALFIEVQNYGIERLQNHIRQFRKEKGRAPENQDEFLSIFDPYNNEEDLYTIRVINPNVFPMEIGIDGNENIFLMYRNEILDYWYLPFGYENRCHTDITKFANSPVNRDSTERYSVRADDGVYVYSVLAEGFAREMDRHGWKIFVPLVLGLGIMAYAITSLAMQKSKKAIIAGITGIAAVMAGIFAYLYLFSGFCYDRFPFTERPVEKLQEYRTLLSEYQQNSVLTEMRAKKLDDFFARFEK